MKKLFTFLFATMVAQTCFSQIAGFENLTFPAGTNYWKGVPGSAGDSVFSTSMSNNTISFITLSEHGVYYAQKDKQQLIPTHIRNIADVSGAGDTVIAVASLVYAYSKDMALAAEIANIAGGLVCELVGTAPIDKNVLATEVKKLLVTSHS